jgi:MFS family permease
MDQPSTLPPILRVFTYRQYALFMVGMTPSLITVWMQRVGIGWLAWELTKSPTWLGVIAAADLAPVLLLAPIAGAYTDRTDPVRQQIWTQWANVIQSVGLVGLIVLGWMNIWLLFVLVLFHGIVHPFSSTSRHAIVPATVPRAEFATAIAVDSASFNGSRFIGPAVGGLLIPLYGIEMTFALNAIAGVFFVVLLGMMRLEMPERAPRKGRNIMGDVIESFSYVRSHAGIGPLFLLLAAASILVRPIQDMLPGFAGAVFDAGAQGLAWLTSSMGVGATIAAVWIAMRGHLAGLTSVVLLGCFGLALATLGFVATGALWVAVIFGVLSGFCLNAMSTSTQALTQTVLTDDLRGRVMGFYTVIYRGTPAFGALAIGALAEAFGLRATFAVAAAICLVAVAWVLPRRRSMIAALETDRRH